MLSPVHPHVIMLAIEASTRSPDRKSTSSPTFRSTAVNGLMLGRYRKYHMIAAITPGSANGRK